MGCVLPVLSQTAKWKIDTFSGNRPSSVQPQVLSETFYSGLPAHFYRSQLKFAGRQPYFGANGNQSVESFAKRHHVQLDPFQIDAMNRLTQGHSVMVAAPTGSGKTLVGNYAIEQALAQGKRAFYTTPRKAISGQKIKDFQKIYGADKVGLMTGDITINPDAPIILMTTEVLRNMQYQDPQRLKNVSCVVFDECHFVNDMQRGPVWEECIMNMPKDVQQVHLSATVGNAKQYTDWMNRINTSKVTDPVSSTTRPVNLVYLFYNPQSGQLEQVFDDAMTKKWVRPEFEEAFAHGFHYDAHKLMKALKAYQPGTKDEKALLAQEDGQSKTHSQASLLFPAVLTRFNRNFCNQGFQENAVPDSAESLLPEGPEGKAIQNQIKALIQEHKRLDPDLINLNPDLEKGLLKGYGVHHAGMTYAERGLVEQGLIRGLLQYVWGTDTLGAGMNMPERTAIISQFEKFDGEAMGPITTSDFQQICGRAGRRGLDKIGYVVLVPPAKGNRNLPERILGYIQSPPENLVSKFEPTPTMVLNLLENTTLESARKAMSLNFAAFQDPSMVKQFTQQFESTVRFLQQYGLIQLTKGQNGGTEAKLTPMGQDMLQIPDNAFVSVLALLGPTMKLNSLQSNGQKLSFSQLSPQQQQLTQLNQFSDAQIAALMSAIMTEKTHILDFDLPEGKAFSNMRPFTRAFQQEYEQQLYDAEQANIHNQAPPSAMMMPYVYQWVSSGGNWPQVRQAIENNEGAQGYNAPTIYIGEFMNNVRRTANLLGKLSEMHSLPVDLRNRLKRIQTNALLRPPIQDRIS